MSAWAVFWIFAVVVGGINYLASLGTQDGGRAQSDDDAWAPTDLPLSVGTLFEHDGLNDRGWSLSDDLHPCHAGAMWPDTSSGMSGSGLESDWLQRVPSGSAGLESDWMSSWPSDRFADSVSASGSHWSLSGTGYEPLDSVNPATGLPIQDIGGMDTLGNGIGFDTFSSTGSSMLDDHWS